jgi:hypothetical protein
MSLPMEVDVSCPACQHPQRFTIWRSLNVDLNPAERERVLNGDIWRFTCEKCGHSASVRYDLLYHDMSRSAMFWLLHEGAPDPDELAALSEMIDPAAGGTSAPGARAIYRCRVVGSENDLIEKITVLEDGWDDRVLEVMKLIVERFVPDLQSRSGATMYYEGQSRDPSGEKKIQFTILSPDTGAATFEIPWVGSMRQIAADLESYFERTDLGDSRWERVDRPYAEAALREWGMDEAGEGEGPG